MAHDKDHMSSQSKFVQGVDRIEPLRNSKDGSPKGYNVHMKNSDKFLSHHPQNSHHGKHANDDHWHMTDKNTGSHKTTGDCFFTTACVEVKGLADNCYELTTLRRFRDNYMRSTQNGKNLIKEYYAIAPKIIDNIKKMKDSTRIFEELYESLVLNSISLIKKQKNNEALIYYKSIVEELKERYM